MMIKNLKAYLNPTLILACLFVGMSFILGVSLSNGLIIFLSWNMVLAIIVYLLSVLVVILYKKKTHKIWIISSIVAYVIFFPNSFYIITDFIHFEHYNFFNMYPNIYELDIYDWYVFFDIVVGALIALKLGILSISNIKSICSDKLKTFEYLGLTALFVLSSIGIYLGRFIRLNSWNILDISYIFNGIFEHFRFFVMFVLLFTIIHMISYILFKEKGE
ncbi:DUF1361 domain-containing protein [Mariniplasma anaerobium]|uniref:Membrane protein n=1 Tax=Mariniplasma anaerobium TaxID=2735436 RepID=A0A7U9XWC0_9MOLU|nr:DUF1361 domain-containing protein [Mariniplasma anaerobium]BCR35118.1 membrane protein [Mariniplasma anaerobium]